jgi:5-methyltetrahydropteroyltriglutamate--homocysteine methyltransferase
VAPGFHVAAGRRHQRRQSGPKFGGTEEQPPIPSVTGKVGCSKPIMVATFVFLKRIHKQTAKFTIPSPAMLHPARRPQLDLEDGLPGPGGILGRHRRACRKAIEHLADAGCTYLQLDDVSFSYLCDPKIRRPRARTATTRQAAAHLRRCRHPALKDRPAGMTVTMHTCRGNFKSSWVASGGYETVAEAMFSSDVDAFFMEFDSERAGGFEPLRYLPKGKKVVLGL